jgi:hypothetical protein
MSLQVMYDASGVRFHTGRQAAVSLWISRHNVKISGCLVLVYLLVLLLSDSICLLAMIYNFLSIL